MQYTDRVTDPCYMSEQEKIEKKSDAYTGKFREKDLNKSVLIQL